MFTQPSHSIVKVIQLREDCFVKYTPNSFGIPSLQCPLL